MHFEDTDQFSMRERVMSRAHAYTIALACPQVLEQVLEGFH